MLSQLSTRILILILLSCRLHLLLAQPPQFVMPIWFEDSVGNKDTVWVGGDPSSSSQHINPQFGEMSIATPFDSVFEVRAVHWDDTDWETSKVIIEDNTSLSQCYLPARTRIMIRSKYPPVTIYWDTTILATNAPCNINTILTPDQYAFLLQNWFDARIIHCMMTRESIQIDNLSPIPPPDQLKHAFQVEGLGSQVIPGLWFAGFWDFPHCYTTLSTAELDLQNQVSLSPNPATNYQTLINYSGLTIASVQVSNLTGQTVFSCSVMGDLTQIPTDKLIAGIYIVQINFNNSRYVMKKIIKE